MSALATTADSSAPHVYPEGFRPRRGLNWACIGLTYTSFYMCRYNLSLVGSDIRKEFGFDAQEFGYILAAMFWAYAIGQFVNGLLTDHFGGKRALLIGAAGTIVLNIAFGAASFVGMLWLFILIRAMDGYMQAFGAPGMIKVNTAWFNRDERGRFAGIFGFMIQLGRFVINWLIPALMAGMPFLIFTLPPLHWRWAFWVPSGVCAVMAVMMAIFTKNTPEEAGWKGVIHDDDPGKDEPAPPLREVLWKIVGNKTVWIVAAAYFCTGVVRQGVDQWFPQYLEQVHNVSKTSSLFKTEGFLIAFVAVLGSLVAGYISDVFFKGRRAPVAAVLYLIETGVIVVSALAITKYVPADALHPPASLVKMAPGSSAMPSAPPPLLPPAHILGYDIPTEYLACLALLAISFTANSTHSLLGTAAAMDIGGRKMAGFASGVIDSFQYIGGGLSGLAVGWLLKNHGWGSWLYALAPFGLLGGILMIFLTVRTSILAKRAAAAALTAEDV